MTEFHKLAKEISDSDLMNMHVQERIDQGASRADLKKEIKLAIKMHRKYNLQVGSSPMHAAVVSAMTRLLDALERDKAIL